LRKGVRARRARAPKMQTPSAPPIDLDAAVDRSSYNPEWLSRLSSADGALTKLERHAPALTPVPRVSFARAPPQRVLVDDVHPDAVLPLTVAEKLALDRETERRRKKLHAFGMIAFFCLLSPAIQWLIWSHGRCSGEPKRPCEPLRGAWPWFATYPLLGVVYMLGCAIIDCGKPAVNWVAAACLPGLICWLIGLSQTGFGVWWPWIPTLVSIGLLLVVVGPLLATQRFGGRVGWLLFLAGPAVLCWVIGWTTTGASVRWPLYPTFGLGAVMCIVNASVMLCCDARGLAAREEAREQLV